MVQSKLTSDKGGSTLDITVVIPTHNRSDALELTLENLSKQDFSRDWEAIVVNNNSTDSTVVVVKQWQARFPVQLKLLNEEKPGAAAARNAGARAARGKFLVFIDNDILTEPDFLTRHLSRLKEKRGCWIVGRIPNLPEQEAGVFGRYRKFLSRSDLDDDGLKPIDEMTGAGTSLPRADFERLGGFDERFFVASGEDRELAMRATDCGIQILYDPTIVAFHNDWAGSGIRDYCRRQRIYTQTEPLFAAKYGSKNPRSEMTRKNTAPDLRQDGIGLFAGKLVKSAVGSNVGQAVMIGLCEVVEKLAPDSRLLWKLYHAAIAGAIYRGYQEGISRLSTVRGEKITDNETTAS